MAVAPVVTVLLFKADLVRPLRPAQDQAQCRARNQFKVGKPNSYICALHCMLTLQSVQECKGNIKPAMIDFDNKH